MRKGIYKNYIRQEYNDTNVKGAIDVARHIKQNTPFVGNVAYNTREILIDNPLTELIRHTIEYIKVKPNGKIILSKVKDEVRLINAATQSYRFHDRAKVIRQNKKNVVRHAYYNEYRALQKLCIMILQEEQHQIGMGPNQIYGILFDGSWLWEEYVNSLIGEWFYHPKNRTRENAQYFFDGRIGEIYPDFIGKNGESRIIADAKYKPIENIRSDDYSQVLAYMYRFDAKKGYYLYPEAGNSDDKVLYLNKGTSFDTVERRDDVCVIKHGLKIPQNTGSYESLVQLIKEYESEFKSELCTDAVQQMQNASEYAAQRL